MPFVYQDTVRGSPRNALTVPSSDADVLREQFAQTFEENPIMAARRWNELREDHKTGPMLPAESARQKLKDAGLENDLKVSGAGITQAALDTLMFRKRIEKKRQEIFARSEGGVGLGAARLGLAFATTLSDPISAGLNFVPVVGQARYARWLAGAGSVAGRIGVRAGAGAIEGAAGAALYEPFLYTMRTQEQADYDSTDSLLNVAFGGVVGSGLHVTVGSLGELYSRLRPAKEAAPRIEPTVGPRPVEPLPENIQRAIFDQPRAADTVAAMTPEAQQAALRAAVGQAIEGRPIDIRPVIQAAQDQSARYQGNLPSSEYLAIPDAPPKSVMDNRARVETVPLDAARRTQSRMGGKSPGALIEGYADRPVAVRLENGEYLVFDGHHRAVAAMKRGDKTMDMYVVDAKQYAPELAGRKRVKESQTDEDLLRALGVDQASPAARSRAMPADEPRDAAEYRAATEQAEATLARDVENTTEANLKAAEEEATLAEAEAKELAKRLGIDMKEDADIAAITEAADKAERWARAAELATVCLVRGD